MYKAAAPKGASLLAHKTFCVLTGASKGFGHHMAVRIAEKFHDGSVLILLARGESGLADTKKMVDNKCGGRTQVQFYPVDLSKENGRSLDQMLRDAMMSLDVKVEEFDHAIIIHNAASLGNVSRNFVEHDATTELQEYWSVNLTSVTVLNSVFLQLFEENRVKSRTVVNISSICSLQPFKSWSLYCAGKAARDMLFRTMALEEPSVRVLNYAPGPLNTDMQREARTLTKDRELREMFAEFHAENKLLSCDQSLDKFIPLLEKNTFDSGAHIDYYDI